LRIAVLSLAAVALVAGCGESGSADTSPVAAEAQTDVLPSPEEVSVDIRGDEEQWLCTLGPDGFQAQDCCPLDEVMAEVDDVRKDTFGLWQVTISPTGCAHE
jgi:hypothetical protein